MLPLIRFPAEWYTQANIIYVLETIAAWFAVAAMFGCLFILFYSYGFEMEGSHVKQDRRLALAFGIISLLSIVFGAVFVLFVMLLALGCTLFLMIYGVAPTFEK